MENRETGTNPAAWGAIMSKKDFELLDGLETSIELNNEKRSIDDLLYGQFPSFENRYLKFEIKKSTYQKSLHYKLKKILGKKVPEYYTLKEVNDLILLHLISFYRNRPYIYKINQDLNGLTLSVKF